MGICCANGCSNRTDKRRKSGVSFHKFPKNEELKEKWVKFVRRVNWNPVPSSIICSEHFLDKYINRTSFCGRTELRDNAIPTIFPNYPSHLHSQEKKSCKTPEPHKKITSPKQSCSKSENPRMEEPMKISEPFSKEVAVQANDGTSAKLTNMVNEKNHLEWKVKELTKRLNHKSIVIKEIRKQNSQLNVSISSMKALMKHFK